LLKNERSHIGARDLADRDAVQVEQDAVLAGFFVIGQLAWAHDDSIPVAVAQQFFLPIIVLASLALAADRISVNLAFPNRSMSVDFAAHSSRRQARLILRSFALVMASARP